MPVDFGKHDLTQEQKDSFNKITVARYRIALATDLFVGREEELSAISEAFKSNRVVILSGMGGIGKTELSRQFAITSPYHFIQIITWKEDEPALFETLLNHVGYNLPSETDFFNALQSDRVTTFKLFEKALSDVDEKNILIIDNVNELTPVFVRNVYEKLNCKIIITTRNNLNLNIDGVKEININNLHYDELLKIFTHTYGTLSDAELNIYNKSIYKPFYGNTQAIVMVSKMLSEQGVSLEDYAVNENEYLKYNSYNHEIHGEEIFDTVANNLSKFFKISKFIESDCVERDILAVMTIVEQVGIDEKFIKSKFGLKNSNLLINLNKMGLINRIKIGDGGFVLSMHPMIAKALELNGFIPKAEDCKEIAKHFSESLGEDIITNGSLRDKLTNIKKALIKLQSVLPDKDDHSQSKGIVYPNPTEDEEDLDIIDVLLDENNKLPIILIDGNGRKLSFDQIAVIPFDENYIVF